MIERKSGQQADSFLALLSEINRIKLALEVKYGSKVKEYWSKTR